MAEDVISENKSYCTKCSKVTVEIPVTCDSCLSDKEIEFRSKCISKSLKRFAWMMVITLPVFFFVGLKYGLIIQWMCIVVFIIGQCLSSIVDWLMKLF